MSDAVGFVLVFSLVVSVVGIVSVAGLGTLQDARDAQQIDNAEQAMEVLADNVGDVAHRGAPSRATEISLSEATMYLGEQVEIEVRDPNHGGDPHFLTKRVFKPRPVVYESGDTELVYVMGAVFRQQPESGTVVRSWSPVIDEERTLIPVLNTRSATGNTQSIKSSTVLVRTVLNGRVVEEANNETSYDNVWINVTSPRRDLWERMLADHPKVTCPPARQTAGTAKCTFVSGFVPEQLYVVDTRMAVALER